MAVSRGQRLRKKAAKAVKRKAVVAKKLAEQRRDLSISKPRHIDLAASPLADCVLATNFVTTGKGDLTVSRKLTLGRYAVSTFEIDRFCLGVEDCLFDIMEGDEYDEHRVSLERQSSPIDPARARLLLRDAVAFGMANGFAPPIHFEDCARLLDDIEPGGEPFEMGDNGRPHYFVGPDADAEFVDYIVETLTEKLGPNGFDVTYPLEGDETKANEEEK